MSHVMSRGCFRVFLSFNFFFHSKLCKKYTFAHTRFKVNVAKEKKQLCNTE